MLEINALNIVLYQPEIPQNTGNIGRTCVLTNSKLHLIKPLGFSINDKQVKRCGMDYWPQVQLEVYENYEEFNEKNKGNTIYYVTTHGDNYYTDVKFKPGDFLVFGRESSGFPDYIREENTERCIRVPMIETSTRSLNLSNTVAVVAYEALKQMDFPHMK